FYLVVLNCSQHAYRTITVALQQTEKLSFGAQTKQCLPIVHKVGNPLHGLIIGANLNRYDSLTACRQEGFARKDLNEKLAAVEADFLESGRLTEAFKSCT